MCVTSSGHSALCQGCLDPFLHSTHRLVCPHYGEPVASGSMVQSDAVASEKTFVRHLRPWALSFWRSSRWLATMQQQQKALQQMRWSSRIQRCVQARRRSGDAWEWLWVASALCVACTRSFGICLSFSLFIYVSIYSSIYLSIFLSIYLSTIYLPIYVFGTRSAAGLSGGGRAVELFLCKRVGGQNTREAWKIGVRQTTSITGCQTCCSRISFLRDRAPQKNLIDGGSFAETDLNDMPSYAQIESDSYNEKAE